MFLPVKNDCGIKAYVGPVFSYYEVIAQERLTDDDWKRRIELGPDSPRPEWVKEFVR